MKEELLNNLDHINKDDYNELSILLDKNTKGIDYFCGKYNKIMNKWNTEFNEFDIPSGIITISINGSNIYYPFGKNKYDENTIFDIASMTKIYTEFILFDVMEEYKFNLDTKILELVDFYDDINYLTIMDLISFNNTYLTKIDIRECTNKKDALNALRTIYIDKDKENRYLYTDLPIMVLTDILETVTGLSYKELFNKYIIRKYNLKNTYLEISDDGNYVTNNKRYVNDPKANIMGGYYGHCGVKATSKDFVFFINQVFKSKYKDLFSTLTKTYNNDGSKCMNKALIGNFNLSVDDDNSLASKYLPSSGFAIQGSVRCHCETCIIIVNGKEYTVTSSIFLDLYTQKDNIIKYEGKINNKISKEYYVDDIGKLLMIDVRSLLSYKKTYKKLTNLVGICRILELYNMIK